MREALTELIATMPHVPLHAAGPSLEGDNVQIISSTPLDYVWPDIERDPESVDGPSPIVLLTAPGAMGKSAAAQAIARSTRALYVDLARVRVGSGSITGELTKALGFNAIGPYSSELKAGRSALVLDSVDEAQLAAGRENFQAFLGDLAWLLMDAVAANQVVMLGRRDSIETTLLGLMEVGITPPLYQVAPLTHVQANELIDLTLDKKRIAGGTYEVHRQHPEPFGLLRDALFEDLATSLDPALVGSGGSYWESVEAFLGYPPVVIALAERLAVDNPASALKDFSSSSARQGQPVLRGALLRKVVEQILDRESAKVRDRIGETLAMRVDSGERAILYGRDEQAARLLAHTGTVGVRLDQPAALIESERAEYEEKIASFLLDHPFLHGAEFANVVFRDYVRAWAVSSPISELYSESKSRSEFLATLPKAGPFFAHFLHALSADEMGAGRIPEELVDAAIHSYARGVDSGYAFYAHQKDRAGLLLHGDPSRKMVQGNELFFSVTEVSGIVTLTSPISRIICVTDHAVILRGVDGHLDFGPDASIVAETVEVDARVFTAYADKREQSWSMISTEEVRHAADLKVSANPPEALTIIWQNPWHQWKPFASEIAVPQASLSRATRSQILLCLRRVLNSFRGSMRDDPSVSADKMDRLIVGANTVFLATLQALQSLGLVSRDGGLYRLNLSRLTDYGISWATLRGDDPVKALRPVFAEIIASPEVVALVE
jgi:hypothetical protein